ncbi:uncharacterized protein [Argopecten irradians]|uniref:uncharacterized protein isoform X2 n=1 Tax=Argopecten irradians TaxID=31199 RepID=UPI00371ABB76
MVTFGPLSGLVSTLSIIVMICCLVVGALNRSCVPITCSPGYKIVKCDMDGGPDKCIPCERNRVQPFNISSWDDEFLHECIQIDSENECQLKGAIHSRYRDRDPTCLKTCECDVSNCYVGATACKCKKYPPCGVNEQLNSITGACEPCPPNKEKKERGCYPCQHVYTRRTDSPLAPPKRTEASILVIRTERDTTELPNTTLGMPHSTKGYMSANGTGQITGDAAIQTKPIVDMITLSIDKSTMVTIIAVGGSVLLTIVIVTICLLRFYRCRKRTRKFQYNNNYDGKNPNNLTIIQENSLLLNLKDNNVNAVRELAANSHNSGDNVTHTNSQVLKLENSTTGQPESGYGTGINEANIPSSHGRSLRTRTASPNSLRIPCRPGQFTTGTPLNSPEYFLSGTPLPTEHDEESTHVKSISG